MRIRVGCCIGWSCLGGGALAQPAVPASPAWPVTAAEAERGSLLYGATGFINPDRQTRVPADQLDTAIARYAKVVVGTLPRALVKGMQLDPMGRLSVTAGMDAVAQRQFDARLATSGLSVDDQAYTLLLAVTVFGAKGGDTARVRIARGYLARLDALSARVIVEKFVARARLASAYYLAGDGSSAATQLMKAFSLVPEMPFERRPWIGGESVGRYFPMLADILSGQPNGRVQIDSIGRWLLAYATAPRELLAKDTPDSVYARTGRQNVIAFQTTLRLTGHLGRVAPAVTANYWFNIPAPMTPSGDAPGSRVKRLDDGIIRVLQFGHLGCAACVWALPKLERLRLTAPKGVETMYVTFGAGVWGATRVTPDEEARHLQYFYVTQKKIGMPIALWIGGRSTDVDGGMVQEASPSFTAYPILGFPWFIVTDGKGIVRHISFGYQESLLKDVMTYLAAEANHASSSENVGHAPSVK